MAEVKPDRNKLLRQIQICDFALLEAGLYLDTHKNDKDAIAYFNKHRKEKEMLEQEYVEAFGPLMICQNRSETEWEWVKGAWPWEMA